jgi:hypothetical protein
VLGFPERADPEVAAATFKAHLDKFWETAGSLGLEITRKDVDPLRVLAGFKAVRDGANTRDPFFVLLGAEYYDRWPPTAAFVDPENLEQVAANSRWWPILKNTPDWARFHNPHTFGDGTTGQMLCFSFTAEYYKTGHSPTERATWEQGRHTVSATITRIAALLRQPYYVGPGE